MNSYINPTAMRNFQIALKVLQVAVGRQNVDAGWRRDFDAIVNHASTDRNFGAQAMVHYQIAQLALVDTEISEAIEEIRNGRGIAETYYTGGEDGSKGVRTKMQPSDSPRDFFDVTRKPEGVPSELADTFIRLLSIADMFGIDLAKAVTEKFEYNTQRTERHGGKTL